MITPVAGSIYVNQNTSAVANLQSDFQAKLELQSLTAASLANEKKREIEEIRPTEETYKIDPENEHEKQSAKEEQPNLENEKNSCEDDEETLGDEHKLNIIV